MVGQLGTEWIDICFVMCMSICLPESREVFDGVTEHQLEQVNT